MSTTPHWIEAGRGSPTLLCLHGISGAAQGWRALLPRFAARGGRVLAWDMPGYGLSAPLSETCMPALAEALERLLDAARIDRVVLVGHSLGGMIALETAVRLPQRIDAMVLACTTPAFGAPSGAAQQSFLDQRLGLLDRGGSMAELASSVIPSMIGAEPCGALVREHQMLMGRIPPASYRAAMHALVRFDRRAALADITCPVLCVAGEVDRVAMPLVVRRMAEALPAGRFLQIPGAGHLAPFERPTVFAAAIEEFISTAT